MIPAATTTVSVGSKSNKKKMKKIKVMIGLSISTSMRNFIKVCVESKKVLAFNKNKIAK